VASAVDWLDAENNVMAAGYDFYKVLTRRQPLAEAAVETVGALATERM
jgi:hypothetical protein